MRDSQNFVLINRLTKFQEPNRHQTPQTQSSTTRQTQRFDFQKYACGLAGLNLETTRTPPALMDCLRHAQTITVWENLQHMSQWGLCHRECGKTSSTCHGGSKCPINLQDLTGNPEIVRIQSRVCGNLHDAKQMSPTPAFCPPTRQPPSRWCENLQHVSGWFKMSDQPPKPQWMPQGCPNPIRGVWKPV